MLEILIATTVSSFVITAYGTLFSDFFFTKKYSKSLILSEKALIGIIFLTFLGLNLNFILALTKNVCLIIFFIGLLIVFKKKIYLNYKIIAATSLITFILVLNSNINRPDAGLYHLPIISMINESKIIIGSSNIHFRFAHGSTIQYLSALYNLSFFNIAFITVPTASIFSFFLYFIYEKFINFFSKKNKFLSLIYFISFIFLVYSFNRYSGYGNDAVAHIYFLYLFLILITLKNFIYLDDLIKIILISVFLIGLKLFMILTMIVPCFLFIKYRYKIKLFKNKSFYICLIFIFSIFLKSLLTSSCALYPIKVTCIKSSEIFNEKQIELTANMSEAWSKGWPDKKNSINNYREYNANFNWIETWKKNHLFYILNKIAPYVIFILFIFVFILFQEKIPKHKSRLEKNFNKKNLYVLLLFISTCCTIWFLKFPLYRFGMSFLFCLILIIFLILSKKIITLASFKKMKYFFFILIAVSLFGFTLKNFKRTIDEKDFKNINYWPKVTAEKKFEKITIDENGYYYFTKGEQCMYSSSPCTYYKPNKLAYKNFYNYKIYWIRDQ